MKYKTLFIIFLMLISTSIFAQYSNKPTAKIKISGTIVDGKSGKAMEYATVSLLTKPDSILTTGTITDAQGHFTLIAKHPGNYIVKIGFIGFERIYKDVKIKPGDKTIQLGKLQLNPLAENIDEVTVKANSSSMEYKIDRKVVHVGEQYAAVSGNAVDVLENVPSIQVDIEGNVSLRGNSNFTVLIDDRPTVLDANEALQQIPASMIQDIEIITNPSAKFDPEGTAGIINIITKKRSLEGLSGIVNLKAGLDDKFGADFLLNYRTKKFNFYIGGDYNDRSYPGSIEEKMHTFTEDTTFFLESEGNYKRSFQSYSARAGIEWFPTDKDVFSISGRYGGRSMQSHSTARFYEWNSYQTEPTIYASDETWERGGDFYSLNGEYSHEFGTREHKLDIHVMYFFRNGDEEALNTLLDKNDEITNSQRSTETGPHGGINYRINYKQPFSQKFKLELGAQGKVRGAAEDNEIFYYNTQNQDYELQPLFSHDVEYSRNIHAMYGLTKGEMNNFGYQVGLRAEYTYREIKLTDTEDEPFVIDRPDFFPTLHFSYQLPNKNQLMASYTRRIDRPRGWYLEPFMTWSDAYNVRQGNPGLKPEYINSYELAFQKDFSKKHSVSLEAYYRSTENRIERIRSVYRENITLMTYENVGTDYSLGTELMLNNSFVTWWESNLTGNFYNYRVKGELLGQSFDRGSFTWSLRWNNIFKISKNTRIQLNPIYHSPEVEAQESETGFFMMNAAIRQNFFDRKMDITLQFRDIFDTAKHESEIDGVDFYSYRLYDHKAPMVMLNFTWRINNYKNRNKGNDGMDNGFDGGGEGM